MGGDPVKDMRQLLRRTFCKIRPLIGHGLFSLYYFCLLLNAAYNRLL
jgi:hypothetical protein